MAVNIFGSGNNDFYDIVRNLDLNSNTIRSARRPQIERQSAKPLSWWLVHALEFEVPENDLPRNQEKESRPTISVVTLVGPGKASTISRRMS